MADHEAMYTKSWRAKKSPKRARWLARLVSTLIGIALAFWFGYVLLEPFNLPTTYLVVGNPPDYLSGGGQRHQIEATLASESPAGGVTPLVQTLKLVAFDSRSKSSALRRLDKGSLGRINSPTYRNQDVLIVVLSGVGLVYENDLKLRLARDVNSPNATTIDVQDTLERIRKLPAGLKLLLIDLQPEYYSASEGQIANHFPQKFSEKVSLTGDKSLWAICSHSNGELPRISTLLNSSHFLLYARNGLAGQADVDGDERITISELEHFISERFAFEDSTSGLARSPQTPLLCWGGGSVQDGNNADALLSLCTGSPDFSVQSFIDKYEESLAEVEPNVKQETSQQNEQAADDAVEDEESKSSDSSSDSSEQFSETWQQTNLLLEQLSRDDSFLHPTDLPRPWLELQRRLAELQELNTRNPEDGDALAEVLNVARFALQRIAAGRKIEDETFPQVSAISVWTEAQQQLADESLLMVTTEEANAIAARFVTDSQARNIEDWLGDEEQKDVKLEGSPALRLLNEYARASDLPPSVIRRDLEIQLEADQLWREFRDLNFQCLHLWTELQKHQIRGRRLLADRIGDTWLQDANREFATAQTQLFNISEALVIIREAQTLSRHLALALPEYLRLRGLIGNQPAIRWLNEGQLEQLLENLADVNKFLMESPADFQGIALSLGQLRRPRELLKEFGARILSDRETALTLTVQELLLLSRSPLFQSEERSQLFQLARERELASWRLMASPDSPTRLSQIYIQVDPAEQLQLEAQLARALVPELALEEERILATLLQPNQERPTGALLSQGSTQLIKFYQGSSNRLDQALAQNRMLADSSKGSSGRAKLAQNLALARLITFSVAGGTTAIELSNQLRHVSLREMELLSAKRDALLLADASRAEFSARQDVDASSQQVQELIPNSLQTPNFRAEVPEQLGFSGNSAELSFSISSSGQGSTRVWAVLEYSPLEYALSRSDSSPNLHSMHELRENIQTQIQASVSAPDLKADRTDGLLSENPEFLYPLPNDIYYLSEIDTLDANKSINLHARLQKLKAGNSSDLVLHVISNDSIQRYVIKAKNPEKQSTTLLFKDPAESWKREQSHLELYPLPNSTATFHPILRNNTASALDANLAVWILQGPVEAVPSHLLSATEWQAYSDDLPPSVPLIESSDIQLAPGEDFAIHLVPPDPPLDESAESEAPEPEVIKVSPYGLLFVVREAKTDRVNLHHLGITPQRPSRIVAPSLDYDAGSGKLNVRLQAKSPQTLPHPNLRFHVQLQTDKGEVHSKGDIWLDSAQPSNSLELFAPSGRFEVLIDMEEYERAFRFSLSSEVSVQNYKTPSQFTGLSIESPAPGTIFQTPVDETTISLKVDTPPGAFPYPWNASDYLEIGVDKNRDRRLEGDAVVRIRSDRQVSLAAALVDDGLRVVNSVLDFRVRIPTDRMINGKANILARLATGSRSLWSEPIPVLFDGEAPKAETVLLPSQAPQDKPLLVTVFPETEQLSKISQVEVLLDEKRLGKFNEDSKPVFAEWSQGNRWQAELDVSKLQPGTYDVLVRLQDEAGNVGEIQRSPVRVVMPLPESVSTANKVLGRLLYRQQPIENEVVDLYSSQADQPANANSDDEQEPAKSVTTDALGRFQFDDLAPGNYRLRAKSVIKNRPRIASLDITVRAKPAAATSVVLEAK